MSDFWAAGGEEWGQNDSDQQTIQSGPTTHLLLCSTLVGIGIQIGLGTEIERIEQPECPL